MEGQSRTDSSNPINASCGSHFASDGGVGDHRGWVYQDGALWGFVYLVNSWAAHIGGGVYLNMSSACPYTRYCGTS